MAGELAEVLHEFLDVGTQKVPGGWAAFSDSLTDLDGEPVRLFSETREGALKSWLVRFAGALDS